MVNKQYTIGLDIGTNSVGWAVIDNEFNLASGKKHINDNGVSKRSRTNLWGVRLFSEADTAADRRLKRGMRRRIARRKERLNYLRGLFENEILKFDDSFFIRMDESFLKADDKGTKTFSYRDENGHLQTRTVESDKPVTYPLFNGKIGEGESYGDEATYYEAYPTIYHLRQRLIENPAQADLRLVYLALHHMMKYRGHFVNQGQQFDLENINVAQNLAEALQAFDDSSMFKFYLSDKDQEAANEILKNKDWSASKKAYELNELYAIDAETVYRGENNDTGFAAQFDALGTDKKKQKWLDEKQKQIKTYFTAIVGNTLSVKDIFANSEYDSKVQEGFPEKIKYSNETFDDQLLELETYLTDGEMEVIRAGKRVYEALVLSGILTQPTLSASMIEKYDLHKNQLRALKQFARAVSPEFYDALFNTYKDDKGKEKSGVYLKYVSGEGDPAKKTSREVFYEELRKAFESEFAGLKFPAVDKEFDFSKTTLSMAQQQFVENMYREIKLENYLPKQRQSDNGAIPYQVHEYELVKIIENQVAYYPFLGQQTEVEYENDEGEFKTESEYKIQALFKFRIPYYVGTLAKRPGWRNEDGMLTKTDTVAKNSWVVRKSDEKVTPWNFSEVVDKEASAVNFIERMTNFDTYLPNEKVLPKNSLLYQEFTIYNELMSSGYFQGGKKFYFTPKQRKEIVDNLFKKNRKVTAKKMVDYLRSVEEVTVGIKELFGIDTFVSSPSYNASYGTYLDLMKAGISDEMIVDYPGVLEEIIKWQTIFEDKKVLKKTIRTANESKWHGLLSDSQINALAKKHYTGWGRLSRKLLDGLKTSEGKTIIQSLKEGSYLNFMRLLEDKKIADQIATAQSGNVKPDSLSYEMVEQLAGSPATKKGIWQSLRIIKELERFLGRESIGKVVIEMGRDDQNGRRTNSRKRQIETFYAKFKESTGEAIEAELGAQLKNADDKALADEKVFLYFLQNGKSMYSGEPLDLSRLSEYQVDHIVPQTYVKDDSIDNKVLVTVRDNQNKGGDTPSATVVGHMTDYWEMLAKNGQVSPRKLSNLKKGKIGDKQREGFINRQLVENRQITKNVANILTNYFKGTKTLVLTPKAGLTTQLRSGKVYLVNPNYDSKAAQAEGRDYKVLKFIEKELHAPFVKNRDLNDYHHAHDAYLNAFVGQYVYMAYPALKNAWVYGEYTRNADEAFGKWASQRRESSLQLLSGMADAEWQLTDEETNETVTFERDEMFAQMAKTLTYRNINIVKKTEIQTGKFGDESVYKADAKAKNFSNGLKQSYPASKYGGTKAPISAITVVTQDAKGNVKPISVSAVEYDMYMATDDKLSWLRERNPNVATVLVEALPKYAKYTLPNKGTRLVASYQEAQNAAELPMIDLSGLNSGDDLVSLFDSLAKFIVTNGLFTEAKSDLLVGKMRNAFIGLQDAEEQKKVLSELLGVTKGSNQNLKALSGIGLGTTAQQLKTGNTITNGSQLIYESVTGLYQSRVLLTAE
ncbi:CRISPR-associated protein, Csn1 family [Weissella confusa]|uniref:type II CRISPR RNA-guided endonuclease Cas9 n=1 Tax=Weissella confusa TaxID=1583 RepID=UPI000989A03E|nr:type II CRISPR RNA-guided endonuclease Cas9 [Weissella confusa]SJX68551.1 CRISPR-associated protein, Csn1 family [Weissella confusa]